VHFFLQQQERIMILRPLLLLIIGYFSFFSFVEISAAECAPDGSIEFVCGPISPEDLAIIPDSEWLIASGMEDEGFLYMVNTDDHSSLAVYPPAISEPATAMAPYQACPGVVDQGFRPHGLSLRAGEGGIHTLYVVRHGAREAIEVFTVDTNNSIPSLTWVGCVPAPDSIVFNSVVAIPDGGIAATNFALPGGELWEWQGGSNWTKVPGSETAGPNGIEVSADGRWFYIAGWGSKSLIRLSRGQTPIQKAAVEVGHHIDNLRWAPDGNLFAAGHNGPASDSIFQCLSGGDCSEVSSLVTKVGPDDLKIDRIVEYPSNTHLILGTVAVQIEDEIWVGGIAGGTKIVRFQAP
jgi:hypothetical protein